MSLLILIIWILCPFLCVLIANDKGYSSKLWFFLGLFGGVISLITIAGLSDRKLRKDIVQIKEKEKIIDECKSFSKKPFRYKESFTFSTKINANENEVFNYLSNILRKSNETKNEFNALKIDSYEFNQSSLGGKAFIVYDSNRVSLLILTSQEKENKLFWSGNF